MQFRRLEPMPALPESLKELKQKHWEVLNTLYYKSRPYVPDERLRADLERHGLLDGTRLTVLGEQAHDQLHTFLEWDYMKDGAVWMSCAVVASDGKNNDVLLQAYGPAIDWHLGELGDDCETLGLEAPEPGIWVWTGTMGSVRIQSIDYGEDWDHEVAGDWREPTEEEWEHIKADECPWTKENLPRWPKKVVS
jgi:hypothetical protein